MLLSLLELLRLFFLLASLGFQLQEKNPKFQWLHFCGTALGVELSRLFVSWAFSQTNQTLLPHFFQGQENWGTEAALAKTGHALSFLNQPPRMPRGRITISFSSLWMTIVYFLFDWYQIYKILCWYANFYIWYDILFILNLFILLKHCLIMTKKPNITSFLNLSLELNSCSWKEWDLSLTHSTATPDGSTLAQSCNSSHLFLHGVPERV